MLLYEAGEALRFDEFAVRAGVKGILAVMRSIGMLTSRGIKKSRIQPMIAKSTSWVRAPGSGIMRTQIPLGREITVNQKIGEIADPFDEEETAVISPVAGIVIGRMNLPLVTKATPSLTLPALMTRRPSGNPLMISKKKSVDCHRHQRVGDLNELG